MENKLEDKMQALDLTTNKQAETEAEDFVDPWNVVGSSDKGIDYNKLISIIAKYFVQVLYLETPMIFSGREVWIIEH